MWDAIVNPEEAFIEARLFTGFHQLHHQDFLIDICIESSMPEDGQKETSRVSPSRRDERVGQDILQ